MPKDGDKVYVYEDLTDDTRSCVCESMSQLPELCGISYRTMLRVFVESDYLYAKDGSWHIHRRTYLKDRRKNNKNPNLKKL